MPNRKKRGPARNTGQKGKQLRGEKPRDSVKGSGWDLKLPDGKHQTYPDDITPKQARASLLKERPELFPDAPKSAAQIRPKSKKKPRDGYASGGAITRLGKPYPKDIDPKTGKKKKKPDEEEEPNMLEAVAEGIGGAAEALGGLGGGGGGQGQLLQAPGTVGKGGIGHVDPEMRARLERKLAGRGGKGFKKGGSVKSRDGIAIRGKTRGRSV